MGKSKKFTPTARQIKVAQLLADPTDTRPKTQKLQSANVPVRTFYNWMENPDFVNYLASVVDTYTDAELPEVWRALIRQCKSGNVGALRLFFEQKSKFGTTTEREPEKEDQIINAIRSSAEGAFDNDTG